jgi:hypothetical protein
MKRTTTRGGCEGPHQRRETAFLVSKFPQKPEVDVDSTALTIGHRLGSMKDEHVEDDNVAGLTHRAQDMRSRNELEIGRGMVMTGWDPRNAEIP